MPPPIPAEYELVEIGLDVGAAEAVVNAESEPLQVREDPVNPRRQHVGRHQTHGLWQVLATLHALVGRQAVRQHGRALDGVHRDEVLQRRGRVVQQDGSRSWRPPCAGNGPH